MASRSACASFLVVEQTGPRRGAGGCCVYLTSAGLARLSVARSSGSSAHRVAGSRRSVPTASLAAAGSVRLAAPGVLAAPYSLLADRQVLLRLSCPYFTGFDTVWQVPSPPGQLQKFLNLKSENFHIACHFSGKLARFSQIISRRFA